MPTGGTHGRDVVPQIVRHSLDGRTPARGRIEARHVTLGIVVVLVEVQAHGHIENMTDPGSFVCRTLDLGNDVGDEVVG